MQEHVSPENVGQKGTNLDVVLKMLNREIVTAHIGIDEFSLYQAAGLASGFVVELIAKKAGDKYPHYGNDGYGMIESLGIFTVEEGCVAVSITRPESNKDGDNRAFLKALGELKQNKAAQSSKATARS